MYTCKGWICLLLWWTQQADRFTFPGKGSTVIWSQLHGIVPISRFPVGFRGVLTVLAHWPSAIWICWSSLLPAKALFCYCMWSICHSNGPRDALHTSVSCWIYADLLVLMWALSVSTGDTWWELCQVLVLRMETAWCTDEGGHLPSQCKLQTTAGCCVLPGLEIGLLPPN